jgi:AAA+ ATPase superfamily predicted ATPase
VEKKIFEKRADPFKVMKAEFLDLTRKGIKPVLIIDELQALDKIYLDNGKERQLITALFNFFVAMTKQSHLAHIIIASSDGYFLNTVFIDSKLKKSSRFYKVDYLPKEDVMEWLSNLEKYSKIKDYTLGVLFISPQKRFKKGSIILYFPLPIFLTDYLPGTLFFLLIF